MEIDRLWWKGLARIMEAEGYIKEIDNQVVTEKRQPTFLLLGS